MKRLLRDLLEDLLPLLSCSVLLLIVFGPWILACYLWVFHKLVWPLWILMAYPYLAFLFAILVKVWDLSTGPEE